jgi:hypothetical protein
MQSGNGLEYVRMVPLRGPAALPAHLRSGYRPRSHLREVLAAGGGTMTDTLHIGWTALNRLLALLAMGSGAAALGMRFIYSVATITMPGAAGILTSREAPGGSANLPTAWIGVWERIAIGAWLLRIVVLAVALLRVRLGRGPTTVLDEADPRGEDDQI